MKKNLGLLLLTGALVLGLTACGGTDKETKTSNASEKTTTQQADTAETTTASDVQEFTITGANWKFSSDKELVIKKGSKVKLTLVNKEGVHTISNDKLGINLKADVPYEFTADKTGEYKLICSTVCGAMDDHEDMKIPLKIIE
jgi:cytochrome c oxidase subunit 2